MPPRRFPLYDFLVDAVPGVVALLIFFSLLPMSYDVPEVLGGMGLSQGVVLLIVSYVVGQLLQAIASPVDGKVIEADSRFAKPAGLPYPFEYRLNEGADNQDFSLTEEVSDHLETLFDSDLSGYNLFSATQSYLWNHEIGRMRRFQRLYTLFRGLYILFAIGGVLYTATIIAALCNVYTTTWSLLELGVITVLLMTASFLSYRRRVLYHKEMARSMIFDIYANVINERNDDG